MCAAPGLHTAPPVDPEQDPAVTYAVDPAVVRRLTGRLVATTGQTETSWAPFTGQPVGAVPLSGPDDVVEAVRRARRAQGAWARVPLELRAQMLLRLHDIVLDRQDELLDVIQWESGKARRHAFEEVAHVAMTARYYARTARLYLGRGRRVGALPGLTRIDVNRVPKGVVGIISPWNYPLTLTLSDGLPALLAGNAVVHKPDVQTPVTALLGAELLAEAGLPMGLWQPVHGSGAVVGTSIVDHTDYICFTGSTRTGRTVAARAAERLVGSSLELGGKNPMLVLHDADLDRAAEAAVRGCFSSAGQLCVSIERMYVADQVYQPFLRRFLQRVESMVLSAAFDYSADMGSLISKTQLDTVVHHVEDARAQGATVLTGGRARLDIGPLFYEPTVLTGVRPGMACFADESFGPVVSVYRFADERDAVERANDGDYGLNASIFTRDARRGRSLARQIRCGMVNVNETYGATFGSLDAPMGGMRSSGLGCRQGVEGVHRYTDVQTVGTQRLLPLRPQFGVSEQRFAQTVTATLRLMKKAGRR